jgi:hypothetical protein
MTNELIREIFSLPKNELKIIQCIQLWPDC